MSALTTRLQLTKPGGGSTGAITPADIVDVDVLNTNFDRLDGAVGAPTYTSTTRPSAPYDGQLIYETDTQAVARFTAALSWHYPRPPAVAAQFLTASAVSCPGATFTQFANGTITAAPAGRWEIKLFVGMSGSAATSANLRCLVGPTGAQTNLFGGDPRADLITSVMQYAYSDIYVNTSKQDMVLNALLAPNSGTGTVQAGNSRIVATYLGG